MSYRAFTRSWWRVNHDWPDNLEPHAGRKSYWHREFTTEDEVRRFCQKWNHYNKPGRLSVKAEFEKVS